MPPHRSNQISARFPARKNTQTQQRKKKPSAPAASKPDAKLHKAWLASLPPSWEFDPKYRHPKGTKTTCLTYAKKTFQLTDREISTLPHRQMKNPHYEKYPMKRYSETDLWNLKARKCRALQMEMIVDGHHYPGAPFQSLPAALPSQKTSQVGASSGSGNDSGGNAPRVIHEYHLLVPPQTPDPSKIYWKPGEIAGPVTVQDACRLYCVGAPSCFESSRKLTSYQITPLDIRDLSSVSPWIDLTTVAKRALELHGGFYAHREVVMRRRIEEERRLTAGNKTKSEFEWSPLAPPEEFEEEEDMNEDGDDMDTIMAYRVAVLYPIERTYNEDGTSQWSPRECSPRPIIARHGFAHNCQAWGYF
ncbi:hypothetical protein V5O48_010538 [Marasmius crinis-equi]|uniref:Uncharacterized protein n=1 Tax=Marasmius crinis-equi TaxID=585013 RepID=A0ABR3F8J9_9AGAR